MDCLIDNNYSGLTITGTITPEKERGLFLSIYSDYCKRSDNEEMYAFVMQIAHMEALRAKITMCKRLVIELYKAPHEVFEQCLKEWGYRIRYTTVEEYKRELDRVVALLRGEDARCEKMGEALEKESKGKTTRADFIDQMAGISKFMGITVRLNDERLTVSEYCSYIKMMKVHYEHLKKLEHGR